MTVNLLMNREHYVNYVWPNGSKLRRKSFVEQAPIGRVRIVKVISILLAWGKWSWHIWQSVGVKDKGTQVRIQWPILETNFDRKLWLLESYRLASCLYLDSRVLNYARKSYKSKTTVKQQFWSTLIFCLLSV